MTSVIEYKLARIATDQPVHTKLKVERNRPDIVVYDKVNKNNIHYRSRFYRCLQA